jgi:hypothetical protein
MYKTDNKKKCGTTEILRIHELAYALVYRQVQNTNKSL